MLLRYYHEKIQLTKQEDTLLKFIEESSILMLRKSLYYLVKIFKILWVQSYI